MSHHYSGPDWGFPRGDPRLDLTDLYAFSKPEDAGKSILVMNVHPSAHDYLAREKACGTVRWFGRTARVGIQAERGARPLQLFLVLGLSGAERDAYLAGEPANDIGFVAAFGHALEHTGGYIPQEARRVAGTMLPEILPYDPTRPASFPENGRALTDDAADAFLSILTNGKVTRDKVGPHSDLVAEFPYLGPPHNG